MLEKRGQRSHMPLTYLLKILRKYMSAKLLETFCTNDIGNCYHQHSHVSGAFFPSHQTYTQFRSHFPFSAEAASGRPCGAKTPVGLPSSYYTGDRNNMRYREKAGVATTEPVTFRQKKSIYIQPAKKRPAEETQH